MLPQILFENNDFTVSVKPAGIISEFGGFPDILSEYYKDRGENSDIFPVHRLDRDVSGVMVYARTQKYAAALSSLIAERKLNKEYLAVIKGTPEENSGEYRDFLFKDSKKNKSYVVKRVRRGVKEAILKYLLIETCNECSLVKVALVTGRSHQIRVQFASRKTPLLGDTRYGGPSGCQIALFSHCISFTCPFSGKEYSFSCIPPENYPWSLFNNVKQEK